MNLPEQPSGKIVLQTRMSDTSARPITLDARRRAIAALFGSVSPLVLQRHLSIRTQRQGGQYLHELRVSRELDAALRSLIGTGITPGRAV